MEKHEISSIVKAQRDFFESGATLPVSFRRKALESLKRALRENESIIAEALQRDLGKSFSEGYMCETGLVISEISHTLKHLKAYARDRRRKTPLAQFPAKSFVRPCPYGVSLIMSPWNYPLLLTLDPLVNALAAGNTAIIKPSAYAPTTAEAVKSIIERVFPREYVTVVTGGRAENTHLLSEKFDIIFFTGSKNVGITVLESAAVHLTPAVLELGGKSPCIVDKTADLSLAAKRIVFGKFLNCGQTCVAPDYILCHEEVVSELTRLIVEETKKQYGNSPLNDPEYGKIINKKHFDRLLSLIDREKTVFGGGYDEKSLKIEPTVMAGVGYGDAVMQEEIFGPILPILSYTDIEDAKRRIRQGDKPLALYIFSSDKALADGVVRDVPFGGGCINDVVIHLATSEMGFGGVGESGMGAYHGRVGFQTFSHEKSIVKKSTLIDLTMRYHPITSLSEKLIRLFLK